MSKSLTVTARIPLPESILDAAPIVEKAKPVIEQIQELLKRAGFEPAAVDEVAGGLPVLKKRGPKRKAAPVHAAPVSGEGE